MQFSELATKKMRLGCPDFLLEVPLLSQGIPSLPSRWIGDVFAGT
jgi:hypothetical protein